MQDYIYDYLYYYAKTFVFIQSSRINKLKLADIFAESCFMINFIFCKDDSYHSSDIKILKFIISELPDEFEGFIKKLL